MEKVEDDLTRLDYRVVDFAAKHGIKMLRWSLGIVYLWFGALKIFDVSPVADLVGKMALGVPKGVFVRLMGILEAAIGLALIFRVALRPTLLLYFMQLLGTFMVFVVRPRESFEGKNPLRLTKTGEFIVKNLVLLAAGVAVGSTVHREREEVKPDFEHEPAEVAPPGAKDSERQPFSPGTVTS